MKIYYKAEISSAHKLDLPYQSKCTNVHGHNYIVEVEIHGSLNPQGMVVDFTFLKKAILKYDHIFLNDIIEQPTAENIALAITNEIKQIQNIQNIATITVRVWEDSTSYAENSETL